MNPKPFITFIFLLFFSFYTSSAQPYDFRAIDSARKTIRYSGAGATDTTYFKTCFFIAESFMEMSLYDSGQIWLNKIAEKLPILHPNFFNFYLSVDLCETYYYSGMLQMNLQESQRMLRIAEAINDSILLGTANNFIGLAYMNVDSVEKSIGYFRTGLLYARQPPYPSKYLAASKPHHLYGNLAEALFKLKRYDEAKSAAFNAKKFASEIPWPRGIAVACNMLGQIYFATGKTDSAGYFQAEAIRTGLSGKQEDVALAGYGALAQCYVANKEYDLAKETLQKGFDLLKEKSFINLFFAGNFLNDAIGLYKKLGENELLVAAMDLKMKLVDKQSKQTDRQINQLVKGSVENELRASALELSESKNKQELTNTRLTILFLAFLGLAILFFVYRYYNKKQIKEVNMRYGISRDLHDDIGASLSGVNVFNQLMQQQLQAGNREQAASLSEKISVYVAEVMDKVAESTWLFKSENNSVAALADKLRKYGSDISLAKEISFTLEAGEAVLNRQLNLLQQKNCFLIGKEAINNAIKYSDCTRLEVLFSQDKGRLGILIRDNGKGMDMNTVPQGNGIKHMQQRAAEIGAVCSIKSAPVAGTEINLVLNS
ncbi:MAG: histidine kinase [Ferruginibacter sp.]